MSNEINRRSFLSKLGAAAAAAQLASLGGRSDAAPSQPTYNFTNSFGDLATVDPQVVALGMAPPSGMAQAGQEYPYPFGTEQPNILMIVVDEWRSPKWLPGGNLQTLQAQTPIVTKLQSQSFNFPNYFTAATDCTPARATLLTGLYSQQTCMFLGADPATNCGLNGMPHGTPSETAHPSLNSGFDTIATALRTVTTWAAGQPNIASLQDYTTAWIGKWHLSGGDTTQNLDMGQYGFTDLGFCTPTNAGQGAHPWNGGKVVSPNGYVNEGTEGGVDNNYYTVSSGACVVTPTLFQSDHDTVSLFQYWATNKMQNPSQPWFCAVSLINPHDIAYFPAGYSQLYPNGSVNCSAISMTFPGGLYSCPAVLNPLLQCAPSYQYGGSANYIQFDAPPTIGDPPKNVPPFPGSVFTALPTDAYNNPWNGSDLITPYATGLTGGSGTPGKPDLQTLYSENDQQFTGSVVPQSCSSSNWATGWLSFLNYYVWMQACADAQIGIVMSNAIIDSNTIVVFLADHGDYGGSHTLKGKGGAAYEESINVPLLIQYPTQRNNSNSAVVCPQMVSSVDIMGYFLSLASAGNGWRAAGQRYRYLAGRESIDDFIFTDQQKAPAAGRRTITVNDSYGVQQTLQYVLHTYDETMANEIAGAITYAAQAPNTQAHLIAIRTAIAPDSQGNPFGGKFAKYDLWQCGAAPTQPPPQGASYHSQYEFYNYSGPSNGNIDELGNQVVLANYQPTPTTGLASQLLTALDAVLPAELYYVPSIYSSAYAAAQLAYLAATGQCGD